MGLGRKVSILFPVDPFNPFDLGLDNSLVPLSIYAFLNGINAILRNTTKNNTNSTATYYY
jgi:hypothetical protein